MMRDEMLRRLDEFIQWSRELMPRLDSVTQGVWGAQWVALRAELAAVRCEKCAHWSQQIEAKGDCDIGRELGSKVECDTLIVEADFCCSHFTKKGS